MSNDCVEIVGDAMYRELFVAFSIGDGGHVWPVGDVLLDAILLGIRLSRHALRVRVTEKIFYY